MEWFIKCKFVLTIQLIEYLIPQLIPYAVSFLVIAAHLINHHLLFSKMKAVNATFIWLNLLFLFSLSLIVYPTALLGQNHNQKAATMLLIGAYFFKAVTFRWLNNYAVFKSGLYITKSTRKELSKEDILNWLKGPLLKEVAFFLIFIDYRLALGIIFLVTLTDIIPSKKM